MVYSLVLAYRLANFQPGGWLGRNHDEAGPDGYRRDECAAKDVAPALVSGHVLMLANNPGKHMDGWLQPSQNDVHHDDSFRSH